MVQAISPVFSRPEPGAQIKGLDDLEKNRVGVTGKGGGIVLLTGADGGGAVGVGVVGGKWVLAVRRKPE